jgi:hypothetical protein
LRSSIILPLKPDVKTSFCEPAFFQRGQGCFSEEVKDVCAIASHIHLSAAAEAFSLDAALVITNPTPRQQPTLPSAYVPILVRILRDLKSSAS